MMPGELGTAPIVGHPAARNHGPAHLPPAKDQQPARF